MTLRTTPLLAATCLAATAAAQFPPAIPYQRTQDLLVVDTTYDGVFRLCDFDSDGDYLDAGEIVPFYTDTIGAFAWSNPGSIACAPDGTTYVADVSTDQVYALRDGNGDGDANDAGEIRVFFDGTNATGLPIPQVQGIAVDALGRVFAAVNNASTPAGPDRILILEDLDGDGDANELNEAIEYYARPATTGNVAASVPTRILIGPDGNLYFGEIAAAGVFAKGVWRLVDGNGNGHCNDAGEATLFWAPSAGAPIYNGLAVDAAGAFYVSDHSPNERVWRGVDTDGSGVIDAAETTLFWQGTGSSWWDVVLRDDGAVLLCDTDSPDKITRLRDLDGDGDALDANEQGLAYQSGLAAIAVAPRAAALQRAPLLTLSIPSPPVGTTTNLVLRTANPGDLGIFVLSLAPAPPTPLPPWGMVEIDLAAFAVVAWGNADATGHLVQPFWIPNVPTAINPYAWQALGGDTFRWSTSNPAIMVVTP